MTNIINKNKHCKIVLIFLLLIYIGLICFIGLIYYNYTYNINNIAKGNFVEELYSPNKEYILRTYIIKNGPITADAMRVEIVDTKNNKIRNIYYNYPQNSVEMEWINENTIKINGITLNIHNDTYDWRRER